MSPSIRPLVVTVPTSQLASDLEPLPEGVELIVWDLETPAPRDEIDLVVPPYMKGSSVLGAVIGVRVGLVQSQSIGY